MTDQLKELALDCSRKRADLREVQDQLTIAEDRVKEELIVNNRFEMLNVNWSRVNRYLRNQ